MTNEQAIAILRRIQEPEVWEPRISQEGFEAIEMAVNALKALPPAQPEQLERCPIYDGVCGYPSDQCYDCPRHHGAQPEQRSFSCGQENDQISRQAAIDVMEQWLYDGEDNRTVREVICELPEIAVSANHFKTMIPLAVEKAKGRKTCGLECLRCKQTYDYSWDTMDEISYTMYSYCPDCIRKGIQLLKTQDKKGAQG